MLRNTAAAMLISACALAYCNEANAQTPAYPTRPVRIVAPDAGSGNDVVLRVLVPSLTSGLGQQVIIDNRGGGGGAIAMQTVAKAAPDG